MQIHRSTSRHLWAGALVALAATGALAAGAGATETTIKVTDNKTYGSILELTNGRTVYAFGKDSKNHSACNGACAKAWPPVVVSKGTTPTGVAGLGTIHRSGGKLQVTFDGLPRYTFIGDKQAGQVTGNITDKFGKWWAVNPTHPQTPPVASSSKGGGSGPAPSTGY